MTTDEAELTLAQFIDRAIVSNLTQVTVIHGKGTGAVRNAVRTYLKRSRYVKPSAPAATARVRAA